MHQARLRTCTLRALHPVLRLDLRPEVRRTLLVQWSLVSRLEQQRADCALGESPETRADDILELIRARFLPWRPRVGSMHSATAYEAGQRRQRGPNRVIQVHRTIYLPHPDKRNSAAVRSALTLTNTESSVASRSAGAVTNPAIMRGRIGSGGWIQAGRGRMWQTRRQQPLVSPGGIIGGEHKRVW